MERVALPPAAFPADRAGFVQRNAGPFGYPRKTADLGATDCVARWGFILEHSADRRIPIWVMERIDETQIDEHVEGDRPRWRSDPQLPADRRAEDADYKPFTKTDGGRFDRGHMCPNADFDTAERRAETFFLSNVVPQIKRNNQGVWAELEKRVRAWVKARGVAYVVTGGMFYDPVDDPTSTAYDRTRADGVVPHEWIGVDHRIAVPTHLFKIVLAPTRRGASQWEAIAFVLENRAYASPYDFAASLKSIQWIEERTDLDFFPNLAPRVRPAVESRPQPRVWPAGSN